MRRRLSIFATVVILGLAAPADTPLDRGLAAFRKRDFATAEQVFTQAIREQPGSARAHKLLGMTYSVQEKYVQAEGPLRRACQLDPTEEYACYYLGRLCFTQGRLVEAREIFENTLKTQKKERGRLLLGLALTLEAMPQPAEAERYYHAAVAAGEKQAQVDYGLFLFKQGRGAEGADTLRKAGATAELERVTKALQNAPAPLVGKRKVIPRFEQSALKMFVKNGASGKKHLIETMMAGVAVFDYDGDGWPDIYVANGAAIPSLEKSDPSYYNRLYRNRRDGTFEDVTDKAGVAGQGYSMGVAAADYDNDGHVDLLVTGVRSNTLYRNRGDGSFEDVTARAHLGEKGRWSVAAAWFDYDGDGLLDLFVVHYVAWDPVTEIYCGVVKPGYRQYCNPKNYQPLPNALYHNQGDGTFRDVSRESGIGAHPGKGMGIAIGDYDCDGRPDAFVANDTVPNFLFHNEGGGKFKEMALAAGVAYNDDGVAVSSMGVDFRDYDNDGREDLFITALSNETFPLFRNLGNGQFGDMTHPSGIGRATLPWTGWSAGIYDFNNDGWKDIFTTGGHVMDNAELTSSRKSRQPNLVLVNNGGKFEGVALPGEALHRGAAFGDFDRDGRIDVVVTRLNESPIVLRNTTQAAGHWVAFRLVGKRSNRDGIGALIHVSASSGEQWNRVATSVGYGGSSDRLAHFGLAGALEVKQVDIEWPSGKRQTLRGLAADRYVTIDEP